MKTVTVPSEVEQASTVTVAVAAAPLGRDCQSSVLSRTVTVPYMENTAPPMPLPALTAGARTEAALGKIASGTSAEAHHAATTAFRYGKLHRRQEEPRRHRPRQAAASSQITPLLPPPARTRVRRCYWPPPPRSQPAGPLVAFVADRASYAGQASILDATPARRRH